MIYKFLINFSLIIFFGIILRIFSGKLFLIKTFNTYLKSVKALTIYDKRSKNQFQNSLDKVSLNGLILLLKLIIFLIPYFLYFCFLSYFEYDLKISTFLSFIPYLLLFRK